MIADNDLKIAFLSGKNASFFRSGDFIGVRTNLPDSVGEIDLARVHLHRMFPFSEPWTNISVQDDAGNEVGYISNIADFSPDTAKMLRDELERSYFVPKIKSILSLKERFGFSTWKVITDVGNMDFTLRDTYRSMVFIGENRIFLTDSDGNRYEIPDVSKLDSGSNKKIELYL